MECLSQLEPGLPINPASINPHWLINSNSCYDPFLQSARIHDELFIRKIHAARDKPDFVFKMTREKKLVKQISSVEAVFGLPEVRMFGSPEVERDIVKVSVSRLLYCRQNRSRIFPESPETWWCKVGYW